MSEKTIGQSAYEAYRRGSLAVRRDGIFMPPWDMLGAASRDSWEELADAVTREWLIAMTAYPDELVEHACDALRNAPGGRVLSFTVAGLNKVRLWMLSKR